MNQTFENPWVGWALASMQASAAKTQTLLPLASVALGIMAGLFWDLAEQGQDIAKERSTWTR